jgi:predicted Zn-dependent peptidase
MDLPHEQLRLDNGLRVVLHSDRRLPRVTVNILYRVGSRDDPRRRSGLAHLFEHLMFMGTERIPADQLDLLMERAGGWSNAYTSEDYTVYYDVGPSRLLEQLLWIEADRMASLGRTITREKLDLQRDVVINELLQEYVNAPYGAAELEIPALLFPGGHPYSRPVIGLIGDLRAVTVRDVRGHFSRYYTPDNSSLVVAGDFEPGRIRRLIKRYFDWIPPSLAPRPDGPEVPASGERGDPRRTFTDAVELAKLQLVWPSPAGFAPGDAEMDLVAEMLAGGKQSLLHSELVYRRRLAHSVEAYQYSRQLGSLFVIEVTARQGISQERLERATEAAIKRFVRRRPSVDDLRRAQVGFETSYVVQLQELRRRAEMLNTYSNLVGRPDYVAEDLARYRSASPRSVHRWARDLLQSGRRGVFWVVPKGGGAS